MEKGIRKKKLIFCLIMLPVFVFTTYMGILTVIRSSKNLDDLDHVSGPIESIRYLKFERRSKFRTYFQDVVALRVSGVSDEFGFINDNYNKLSGLITNGRIAEIYYDKNGKRIEENITLHVFDMNIGYWKVIDINEVRNSDRWGTVIFFSISILFLIMTVLGLRNITHKKIRSKRSDINVS